MSLHPTNDEVAAAASLLAGCTQVSKADLDAVFGESERCQADDLLRRLGHDRLTRHRLAELIVRRHGVALFSGSAPGTVRLRTALLRSLPENELCNLFDRFKPGACGVTQPNRMAKPLAGKTWRPAGAWPRAFVAALGLPALFAGVADDRRAAYEDVEPRLILPELRPFQRELKGQMLAVLTGRSRRKSCVVSLPTGGGKTRLAVEAFIDWLHPRFSEGKYLLWVAQSEELCEQAIACVRQLWSNREFLSPLRVYRGFGSYSLDPKELRGGIVVANIQKLWARLKSGDESVETVLRQTGALIIDEAHRACTPMYDLLYDHAERLCGPALFPVCGLTATPGRSGGDTQAIAKLVKRFAANLIAPPAGLMGGRDPLKYFRDEGYLARARLIVCQSGREYTLTDADLDDLRRDDDLPDRFRRVLAADVARNRLVLARLGSIPAGSSALVYACTADHARFLATMLCQLGHRAAAVLGDTPPAVRRGLIHEFKAGRLNYLCNYGVLTTGFDAPRTTHIVLTRPTTSEVLYEQIVGRGMRGPQFGGTDWCEVIDFADTIQRLGRPLAHTRFVGFWSDEANEAA